MLARLDAQKRRANTETEPGNGAGNKDKLAALRAGELTIGCCCREGCIRLRSNMNYVYNKNLLINLAEVCTVFVENKKCDNLLQPGVPALIVSQSQMDSGAAC